MTASRDAELLWLIEDAEAGPLAVVSKNTFIELAMVETGKLPRSNSEPDLAEPRSWGPIVADVGEALSREREGHIQLDVCQKEEARSQACVEDETLQSVWQSHLAGNCLPCIFIWRKDDGCRHGDACTHCHFCPPEEAKRKRNRMSWESKKRNKAAARR